MMQSHHSFLRVTRCSNYGVFGRLVYPMGSQRHPLRPLVVMTHPVLTLLVSQQQCKGGRLIPGVERPLYVFRAQQLLQLSLLQQTTCTV